MVITLRDIPAEIEEALRRIAHKEGKSVDRVTMDLLAQGLGVHDSHTLNSISGKTPHSDELRAASEAQAQIAVLTPGAKRELSSIAGTWVEDPEFDAILEAQRQIDPELWQ